MFNLIIISLFGLCFGSFITMASHRLAINNFSENISTKDKIGLILKRSFCPNCSNPLKIRHLFPIFSWIFYKGKCNFCKTKISVRYPLIEISTSILFIIIYLALGSKIDIKLIFVLLMAITLIIMTIVDLEYYFIPDITQIILAILAILYHIILPDNNGLSYYLLSGIALFVCGLILHYGFLFLTKKQGIGEDDIKFFAVAGFILGFDKILIFAMLGGIFGIIFGLIWTKLKQEKTFPFAPALSISLLSCIIFKIDYVSWLGTVIYWFGKYVTKTLY